MSEYRYDTPGNLVSTIKYSADLYTTAGTPTEPTLAAWTSALVDKSRAMRTDYAYDWRGSLSSGRITAVCGRMVWVPPTPAAMSPARHATFMTLKGGCCNACPRWVRWLAELHL